MPFYIELLPRCQEGVKVECAESLKRLSQEEDNDAVFLSEANGVANVLSVTVVLIRYLTRRLIMKASLTTMFLF